MMVILQLSSIFHQKLFDFPPSVVECINSSPKFSSSKYLAIFCGGGEYERLAPPEDFF